MNIPQIQCFCAVAKYRSFSLAADALFMSQSAVSKHMAAFEKDCGFPLIVRRGRNIELSIEGQLMLRDCNKLLAGYEQLLHLQNEMRKKPYISHATFSLIGNPDMALYGVISSINKFSENDLEPSIHLREADEVFARLSLLDGETDLAFTSDIGLDSMQYSWQNYCTETLSAAVSRKSPLADKDKIYLEELKKFALIVDPPNTNLFDFCLKACQKVGFEPRFVFLSSRLSCALDYMAEHPDVVYVSTTHSFERLRRDQAIRSAYQVVDIKNSPSFHYVMAWKKNKILNDKIKQYLRLVAEPASDEFMEIHKQNTVSNQD